MFILSKTNFLLTEENHIANKKLAIRKYLGSNHIEQAFNYFLDLHQGYTKDGDNEMDIRELVEKKRRHSSLTAIKDQLPEKYEEIEELARQITSSIEELITQIPDTPTSKSFKTVVQANDIIKNYRSTGFKLSLPELTLKHGEITVVVGENATGKSTLLRILAGDLAVSKGNLTYPNFHNGKFSLNYWGKVKQQIAYIPQELPKWTGNLKDHLHYEAAIHGIKGRRNDNKVDDFIIDRLGLYQHINKSWKQLSGGYKLRFSLAKALVWRPQLLIIDEPLAHLDVNTQLTVLQTLRDFANSRDYPLSIILSSQHLHETEAIADQWLFVKDGLVEVIKDLGQTAKYNHFELNCNLTEAELKALLKELPCEIRKIEPAQLNTRNFSIKTPKSTTKQQLLNVLSANENNQIHYFRDITNSIKTKFS